MTDCRKTDCQSIAAAVNAGASATVEVEAALARAEADSTNAIIRVYRDTALAAAKAVDARIAAGEQLPLAGVPVVLKDNMCYQDHPVTACSKILAGFTAPYQATAVTKLRDAGAVVIAAANMDEFAMGSSNETSCYGPVSNPVASDRIPGGSSGGSAASVAGGITPLALGSDTGGSIRQPASLCGCLGLKPTYGCVSRYGLLAFGSSLDQIGPFTTTVEDAALVLSVLAGHDKADSTSANRPAPKPGVADQGLAGKRVGWVPAHVEGLQSDVAEALERAKAKAVEAGAELVEISLPHEKYAVAVYYVVATGEASSNLSRYDGVHYGHRTEGAKDLDQVYSRSREEGFGAEVKRRIMLGTYVLSAGYYDAYYKKAMQVRSLICKDFATCFEQCDVILGPTSPTTAFKRGEKTSDPLQMYLSDVFTIAANLAGIPALSVPMGTDSQGLPIGLHLQAPQFADEALLAAAKALMA
ncbi:MAG: Asp-tRNA(Asn)/Glu-tRNA(Gln) amidotransferase subunit GatA [Planctomycetota bacterium]|jgi:aspartyl-tRNA(Asn)/glutamyl-tRNA(Gln) amidotransferase subunit A|nr:Asp-tRNA(Asn)/Glu-tRNA(Gln) amidotransferase subunit GatA [Planctomycetota bacterium]